MEHEIDSEICDWEQVDSEIHNWEKPMEHEIDSEICDWEQVDREIQLQGRKARANTGCPLTFSKGRGDVFPQKDPCSGPATCSPATCSVAGPGGPP
jgi:hypothetical protein